MKTITVKPTGASCPHPGRPGARITGAETVDDTPAVRRLIRDGSLETASKKNARKGQGGSE